MKILLDHNLDRRLKDHLAPHEAATTQEEGWADLLNGELISLAEENGFDVIVTADSHIKDQQNLIGRRLSIIALRAYNNRLKTHLEMLEPLFEALSNIKEGEILEVSHTDFPSKKS